MSTSFSEFKPITAETHFLLLPLFYSFPKELIVGSEFFDLPRNLYEVISDRDTLERIESKQFLKDMIFTGLAVIPCGKNRNKFQECQYFPIF